MCNVITLFPNVYLSYYWYLKWMVGKWDLPSMQISPFSFKKVEDLSFKNHNTHTHKPLFSEVDNNNLSGQESFYNGPLASSFKKNHFFGKKKWQQHQKAGDCWAINDKMEKGLYYFSAPYFFYWWEFLLGIYVSCIYFGSEIFVKKFFEHDELEKTSR